MAEELGKEVDEIREMMVSSGATHQLKTQLLEEKVLQYIEDNSSAPGEAKKTESNQQSEDKPSDDDASTQEEA